MHHKHPQAEVSEGRCQCMGGALAAKAASSNRELRELSLEASDGLMAEVLGRWSGGGGTLGWGV